MRFWHSPWGTVLLVLMLGTVVGIGAAAVQVDAVTRPERRSGASIDFEAVVVRVQEVEFQAVDDIRLSGWLLRGQPGQPAIVMCHDLGQNRTSLTHLAVGLWNTGFTVLLFDFRAHGESDGGRSSLGLKEKRDILGALEFLRGLDGIDQRRIGIYGVGMGAYAAVLAASDHALFRVLVLDGLYPDVSFRLARDVYSDWVFGVERLSFLPTGIFSVMQVSVRRQRAAEVITELWGRDLLLLAPEGDAALTAEMKKMYEGIPEQADADGNLVILPATQSEGLYGDGLGDYYDRVSGFFVSRLIRP